MQVEYEDLWQGKYQPVRRSISNFSEDILFEGPSGYEYGIEKKITRLGEAVGTILERLVNKGTFDLEDLKAVLNLNNHNARLGGTLKFVPDDQE